MKLSERWLREWVNPSISREALCHELTMAGLEVEEAAPVAERFSGVVVGKVQSADKHPEADRLHVCQVDIGHGNSLQIVCGAANVKAGMLVPVATVGALLPGNKSITAATLRGVQSQGMLCSAKELGLSEESEGLLALPADADPGLDLRQYLDLDDYTIDISITPNRGDCLSVKGIAREVSAITKTPWHPPAMMPVKPAIADTLPVEIKAPAACPRYTGRIMKNVKADIATPHWLKESLRRSGMRSINPIVDVTNYVMLELGQPMHAFDLGKIDNNIIVRFSNDKESIDLLDGSKKILDDATLVIADSKKPLAIAGVMGGMESGVTTLTHDIFLESAFFDPKTVAKQRQQWQLTSDSAYRFERGVDPVIQREALERATRLILEICGGEAGAVVDMMDESHLPPKLEVVLQKQKLDKVLGVAMTPAEIADIFNRLQFKLQKSGDQQFNISIPSYRFDISQPEDLIEEAARLYGYDNIPVHGLEGQLKTTFGEYVEKDLSPLKLGLVSRGYHEIVSYSFVDKQRQLMLDPDAILLDLVNPISAEMSVMRTNLWPGLIHTLIYNQSRQQTFICLFETGLCFHLRGGQLYQEGRLGGLLSGSAAIEQWGVPARKVDFYDLKGHLEEVLNDWLRSGVIFKTGTHPALHPGQTAGIYHHDACIGVMGALHPGIMQALDLPEKVFLFEMDLTKLSSLGKPLIHELSKFPEIRRDIAILVNQTVPVDKIQATIKASAGDWLKDVFIFDVYQGKGISPGLKSIALALVWQHPTRTLVDEEVAACMSQVTAALKGELGAELRS